MFRDLLTASFAILVTVLAVTVSTAQQPANATPSDPTATNATPTLDPAAVMFDTSAGLVLHAVKPGSVADYEAAIVALQDAFAKSTDAETRTVAGGWRVYKAAEADAKANALYVHLLAPTVKGVDYRPSQWLDNLLAGAPAELLAKYRDAFAAAPTKLGLTAFAHMAVAPANVSPANATPVNATPKQPPPR